MSILDELRGLRKVQGAIATYAFAALCVLMPIMPGILPVLLIAGVVALVVHHRLWNQRFHKVGGIAVALLIAALLYGLHLAGMLWSVNMDYGLFDLEIKAPLLVLPLIFFLLPIHARHGWGGMFPFFILGNVAAVVICCALVAWRFVTGSDFDPTQEVFGERFSVLVHPSYFALYLCFALVLLFLRSGGSKPGALLLQGGVLCIGVVLCGSKMGWALLPIILLAVLIMQWKEAVTKHVVSVLLVTSLGCGVGLVIFSPGVRERIAEAVHSVMHPDRNAAASTSSEVRKLAWDGAMEVVHAHGTFGTGTGDVKDELIASYQRKGYVHLVERRINAHSQYLQLWAGLGYAGLALMLLLVVAPLIIAVLMKQAIAAIFFALCGINWAVESMLEVQAGVIFFAFFTFVLATNEERTSLPVTDPT